MNYSTMTKLDICVEADKYLSALNGEMRPAFDYANKEQVARLAELESIGATFNLASRMHTACAVPSYINCTDRDEGRAIAIRYLKVVSK